LFRFVLFAFVEGVILSEVKDPSTAHITCAAPSFPASNRFSAFRNEIPSVPNPPQVWRL